MFHALAAWLIAGSPPHWHYAVATLLALLLVVSEILSLTHKVKANGIVQAIAHGVLMMFGARVPLLSKVALFFASDAFKAIVAQLESAPRASNQKGSISYVLMVAIAGAGLLVVVGVAGCSPAVMAAEQRDAAKLKAWLDKARPIVADIEAGFVDEGPCVVDLGVTAADAWAGSPAALAKAWETVQCARDGWERLKADIAANRRDPPTLEQLLAAHSVFMTVKALKAVIAPLMVPKAPQSWLRSPQDFRATLEPCEDACEPVAVDDDWPEMPRSPRKETTWRAVR